ncbi:MAG TPA: DUF433 domain-containing protein, partial [Ilumatobacteraceae bacterium]|nr:DUF433 domain-containing protein [Ilumatobacteraceae bacterium]
MGSIQQLGQPAQYNDDGVRDGGLPTSFRFPCIRGTRIPVATVVAMVAEGMSIEGIRTELPQLAVEDVRAALRYAAAAV